MIPISNQPISLVQNETFTGTRSVSTGVSIADWIAGSDWTLALTVSGCSAGPALVSVEDSADGFVDDIQVVATLTVAGPVNPGTWVSNSWRARELPSFRVGVVNAAARISVTSANSACSLTLAVAEIK